jgi:ribosomal protein L29
MLKKQEYRKARAQDLQGKLVSLAEELIDLEAYLGQLENQESAIRHAIRKARASQQSCPRPRVI